MLGDTGKQLSDWSKLTRLSHASSEVRTLEQVSD